MSSEIFHFMVLRSAQKSEKQEKSIISPDPESQIANTIKEIVSESDTNNFPTESEELKSLAKDIINTPPDDGLLGRVEKQLSALGLHGQRDLETFKDIWDRIDSSIINFLDSISHEEYNDLLSTVSERVIAAAILNNTDVIKKNLTTALSLNYFWETDSSNWNAGELFDYIDSPVVVEIPGVDFFRPLRPITDFRTPSFGPIGVGDLEVVQQKLLRYEAGEVAHVENIMKGEVRERRHRLLESMEETLIREEERTTTSEEDLTSSERFELQREAEKEIEKEKSLEAGLTVTAKYGPSVEATATMNAASSTAKKEAKRRSSQFARELTRKASKKIQERIREQRTVTTIRETEENNLHSFSNPDGQDHITGVYRYLNKVYEMKLLNYGKRLLFEFIVPEPAIWLKWAQRKMEFKQKRNSTKPQKLTNISDNPLKASDITPDNYLEIAERNGGVPVPPPPPFRITEGKSFSHAPDPSQEEERLAHSDKIDIEEGYKAVKVIANVAFTPGFNFSIQRNANNIVPESSDPDNINVLGHARVGIAGVEFERIWQESGAGKNSETLEFDPGIVKELPFYIQAFEHELVAVTIEAECERTEDLLNKWRADVYDILWADYEKRLTDYKDNLARNESDQFEIPTNPARLREIEREELKRRIIEMLAPNKFGGDGVIKDGPDNTAPILDIEGLDKLAPQIRFFEQSFEWYQMTYHLYPYYWAEERSWHDLALQKETDPLHGNFLRSGAARVIIPVRPGFEAAIHYFLWSGKIPTSLDAPLLTDKTFLPIAQEIAEATGREPDDALVVDCWEQKVPTNLVSLKGNQGLPDFPASEDCND